MSKVTAPLLSFGASGQIGKSQVYGTWRGIPYARRHVVPANPNSTGQQLVRNIFSYLNAIWKQLDSSAQSPWTANATGQKYVNRNKFISSNAALFKAASDNTDFIASPGALGGFALTLGSLSAVSTTITVPTTPLASVTGFTLAKTAAVAIPKVTDFAAVTNFTTYYGEATSTPWSISITAPSDDYEIAAWAEYTRSDGKTAYGVSSVNELAAW